MRKPKIQEAHTIFIEATFGSPLQQEFFKTTLLGMVKALVGFVGDRHKSNKVTVVMDGEEIASTHKSV